AFRRRFGPDTCLTGFPLGGQPPRASASRRSPHEGGAPPSEPPVAGSNGISWWGLWSGKRDLNPRPSPWQGDALPLSYSRPDRRRTKIIRTSREKRQGAATMGEVLASSRQDEQAWR